MSSDQNKEAVLALLDRFFHQRQPSVFLDDLTPDVLLHISGFAEPFRGPQAAAGWATQYLNGFDSRITIHDIVAEGDIVMVRWVNQAHHKGDYMGIPATGRDVVFTEAATIRMVGGKGREVWIVMDILEILKQMGLFPRSRPPRPLMRMIIWLQRLGGKRRKGTGSQDSGTGPVSATAG